MSRSASVMRSFPDAKPGEPRIVWSKGPVELSYEEMAEAAISAMKSIRPVPRVKRTKLSGDGMMAVFPIADPHVGSMSYIKETGVDCNVGKVSELVTSGFSAVSDLTAPADRCVIAILGDLMHYDGIKPVTNVSGHLLDADTRYSRMYEASLSCLATIINIAMRRHNKVEVVIVQGNHDTMSSVTIAIALRGIFSGNRHVSIVDNRNPFVYIKHGKVLLGLHHGDVAPARLASVMASDVPEMWGETEHRVWFCGHKHCRSVVEFPGVTVERFRPPHNGRDYWSHKSGYRSAGEIVSVVFSEEHGEVSRNSIKTMDMGDESFIKH